MPIPINTTTVTVLRPGVPSGFEDSYFDEFGSPSAPVDPLLASYDLPVDQGGVGVMQYVVITTGLRAHIGSPAGTENIVGGDMESVEFKATTDPFDIEPRDQILDERNGVTYDVITAVKRDEISFMSHSQVTLNRQRGLA